MELIRLGIDNGNYNTKSSDRILYASGYTMQDTEFITPDQQLKYNGRYYAIGDRRMSFQQEKVKEDDTFILSLPMLANAMKLANTHEAEFTLGVGLPIEHFGAQKSEFRQYFLRDKQEFEFEEQQYTAIIRDCQVFPQGYAALCNCYGQFRECQSVTIVDIGGYTVDVMTVINDKPSKSSCMSLRKGTITLFNEIRAVLQQRNITLSDELISSAIQGRIQHSEREWILEAVSVQVKAYLKDLLNALREHGLDLRLPVAFAGGGAELLRSQLTAAGVNLVAILDRFANAEGYKVLLRMSRRERVRISINMDNPQHLAAYRVIQQHIGKQRSEFIVDCVNKYSEAVQLEAVLSRILDEKLIRFVPQLNAPTPQAPTDPVELPEALRSFADSF